MDFNEVLLKITNAIMEFVNSVPNWNWTDITTNLKNFLVGGGIVTALKFGIPFFKNSNKPLLVKLGLLTEKILTLSEEVKTIHDENGTLKTALNYVLDYVEVSANVNLSSRTLTVEQKAAFDNWVTTYRTNFGQNVAVEKVAEIVSDGVITKEEVVELGSNAPVVEKVLGTPLSQIFGGSK